MTVFLSILTALAAAEFLVLIRLALTLQATLRKVKAVEERVARVQQKRGDR